MPSLDEYIAAYKDCRHAFKAAEACGYALHETYPPAGFYVYILIDPRDFSIFYVGKGIGGRVLKHSERTRRGVVENRQKVKRMQDIYQAGMDTIWRILFAADMEEVALAVEADITRQLSDCGLTNIQCGNCVLNSKVRSFADSLATRIHNFRQAFAKA